MNAAQAQRVVESLRKGIPPDGYVRYFTVGRSTEILSLSQILKEQSGTALLIKANYGSGKTHLLRYLRESALRRNFAVSSVTLDSSSAVRFNRMDQILGAVCRGLEIPASETGKGIRPFLDFIENQMQKKETGSAWEHISNDWKWDYSEVLESQSMFVALRAWVTGKQEVKDIVENWLCHPWNYRTQRTALYLNLVHNLRSFFRDPRSQRQFNADDVFMFQTQGHFQSWAALKDINTLARSAGLNGLIILFDEFEDVITNLKNIGHQESAFWNLFQFFSSKRFPGKTFYAVTPAFAEKCKERLFLKGRWDFDFSRFDSLPTYEMSPLTAEALEKLSLRILKAHGIAYEWEPDLVMRASDLNGIIVNAAALQLQDRARHVIISVVKALDDLLQENQ